MSHTLKKHESFCIPASPWDCSSPPLQIPQHSFRCWSRRDGALGMPRALGMPHALGMLCALGMPHALGMLCALGMPHALGMLCALGMPPALRVPGHLGCLAWQLAGSCDCVDVSPTTEAG